ncbi:DUF1294 domain-containing protein [Jiella avicenniae]|uniref:DUF1294 domain-containing protein n=1 Tax=Jiella avicenniae TaxID=2907202 RepID=A0A9X1NZ48_9HYPH|nr:DUF1294 domain-containing protein [Jiella avicenniae]MCE7026358.1 DUF1294 domain-containing protein [Jiella avicenniae]
MTTMDGTLTDGIIMLAIGAYLVAINCAAYLAFLFDKRRARQGGWRISEQRLLSLALMGGSVGAIAGQKLLRHKTNKEPFRTQLLLIAVLHGIIVVAIAATLIVSGPHLAVEWFRTISSGA